MAVGVPLGMMPIVMAGVLVLGAIAASAIFPALT